MSLPLFPDVNVWVALHHGVHVHHRLALDWYQSQGARALLVFCRQTQMGFFRLLTTEAVMGDEALSQQACWQIYHRWIVSGRARLLAEPVELERLFEQRTQATTASPKTWADAYLAAFAEADGLRLVTFDRALAARSPGSVLLG